MACRRIRDRLVPYIDQTLSEFERMAVHRHLAHCKQCCEIHERMTQLQFSPKLDVDDQDIVAMHGAVHRALQRERQLKHLRSHPWKKSVFQVTMPLLFATMLLLSFGNATKGPASQHAKITQQTPTGVITPTKHWF